MTNADRIRKMTDEDLAKFIRSVQCHAHFGVDCGYPTCPQMDGTGQDLGCGKVIDNRLLNWLSESCQD